MGGDPIPGPLSSGDVEAIAVETSLLVMIRSLKDLERSIKNERVRLTKELAGLKARRAEEVSASARLQEAIEAVGV